MSAAQWVKCDGCGAEMCSNRVRAHRCDSPFRSSIVCDETVAALVNSRFATRPDGAVSVTLTRGDLSSLLRAAWAAGEGFGFEKADKVSP